MIFTILTTARAFLAKVPWQIWAVAAVLLSAWLWGNHRYFEGRSDERARWETAAAKAKARADKATVTASEQRATDTIRNTEAERARHEATVDGGRIGRDCERLRQAGTDLDTVAACRGR